MGEPCLASLVVTARANTESVGAYMTRDVPYLDVECSAPPAARCYWFDPEDERKTITAEGLAALQLVHDAHGRE